MTAAERLKSLADRILKLMADRDDVSSDIKDVFTEVKSAGLNAPALRKVIVAMRMDPEKRQALEFDIDAYRLAIGFDQGASLDDQPRVVAAKMLAEGKGVRETARATGIKKSTVADLSGKIGAKKIPDTPSPAGGENSSDASPPQAASQSSREVPAGEPIETDRAAVTSAPEGAAAKGGESLPPAPDPDAGWQAKDGHDSYILALQVANGKVPHPADASHIVPIRSDRTAADAGPLPVFLDRRARHA